MELSDEEQRMLACYEMGRRSCLSDSQEIDAARIEGINEGLDLAASRVQQHHDECTPRDVVGRRRLRDTMLRLRARVRDINPGSSC